MVALPTAMLLVGAAALTPAYAPSPPAVPLCGVGDSDDGSVARGGSRPILSGPEQVVDSEDGFFRVHWTHQGEDRIGEDDEDGSGVPDDIERVLAGLTEGRQLFEGFGYRPLVPDLGEGGSSAIDVYVRDIDAFGFAYPVDSDREAPVASCYMELDNALRAQGDGVLESVAVHELHHCVQYTYTPNAHSWIYEATATLEQYRDRRSGALDAALEFLWAFRLRDHSRPVSATGDRFEYAGFVFMKFWEEFENEASPQVSAGRVPDLWEAVALQPRWKEAFDSESRRVFGRGWDRTFRDFATWNLFACSRSDGLHYDGATFPCTLPATSVPVESIPAQGAFTVLQPEVTHTATFHEMDAGGDDRPAEVRCEGPGEGAEVRLRLLALDASGRRGEASDATLEGDASGSVALLEPVDPGGRIALVVASTGEGPVELRCEAGRNDPAVTEGEGCECNNGGSPRGGPAVAWMCVVGVLTARRRASPASCAR